MNLKITLNPVQGYNKIFDVGEYGMKLTKFGLLKLEKGTTYKGDTGETEVAFVLMGGNFRADGDGWSFEVADGRTSPFTGKPHCLYLPRRTKYAITALSDVELAYNGSPATRDTARPTLIKPEDTRHIALGKDNWTRTSEIILDEQFDSEHFYIGEGMIPSGNWSGYPSHRHDVNNPPAELDMEETYFYLFDPPQGFGFQARLTRRTACRATTPSPLPRAIIRSSARPATRCTISGQWQARRGAASSRRWIPRTRGSRTGESLNEEIRLPVGASGAGCIRRRCRRSAG